ncbi:cytochrome b561 [Rhizobium subbaraonis]|uniref:Cytochrome b561 n=1 Tax=Rhizobium subbaraonis TaxID=908946 RepID=A0A285U0H4_9HYPH|nr:cytochrome b/b6 domain-containing protein [Rhizobium subbaraonis]SOC35460.1 cytochrome b561 [Rhizobium subbaraonis]
MRKQRDDGYGIVAICLHWLIAALVLGLVALGFAMRRAGIDPALQFSLYQWHKSFGLLALSLAGLRLLLWLAAGRVAPDPDLGIIERRASTATHLLLGLLCLLVPLAGWAVASTTTLNIPTFLFNIVVIPPLPMARSVDAEGFWSWVHATTAYTLLGLAALHSAAALFHHLVRREGVLMRMLRRRAVEPAPPPANEGRER